MILHNFSAFEGERHVGIRLIGIEYIHVRRFSAKCNEIYVHFSHFSFVLKFCYFEKSTYWNVFWMIFRRLFMFIQFLRLLRSSFFTFSGNVCRLRCERLTAEVWEGPVFRAPVGRLTAVISGDNGCSHGSRPSAKHAFLLQHHGRQFQRYVANFSVI